MRLRTFNRHKKLGCWYPSPRYFVVPKECALDLAKAIEAAASGERYGPEPEWYRDFEEQYNVRRERESCPLEAGEADKVSPKGRR